MSPLEKVRVDKWLWAVRAFKTRTLATQACKSGKVKIDERSVKPSFLLEPGFKVSFIKNGEKKVFEVLKLLEKRVGAGVAPTFYSDLSPKITIVASNFIDTINVGVREKGLGRPTKKDRRKLDDFKNN